MQCDSRLTSGKNFEASFLYSGENIVDHSIRRLSRPFAPFCDSPKLLEHVLQGIPHIVSADLARARQVSKRLQIKLSVHGDRVNLIPYLKQHVERYHLWMQDDLLREQTCSEPLTIQEELDMQVSWAEDIDKITFIVVDKESEMIGDVNLFFYEEDEPFTCEINIMIAETSRRRGGMGAETVRLVMSYGWHRFGARKFLAKIGDENHASIALFKKLGFEQVPFLYPERLADTEMIVCPP